MPKAVKVDPLPIDADEFAQILHVLNGRAGVKRTIFSGSFLVISNCEDRGIGVVVWMILIQPSPEPPLTLDNGIRQRLNALLGLSFLVRFVGRLIPVKIGDISPSKLHRGCSAHSRIGQEFDQRICPGMISSFPEAFHFLKGENFIWVDWIHFSGWNRNILSSVVIAIFRVVIQPFEERPETDPILVIAG